MEKKIIKLMKEIKMEHCKYFRLKGLMRNPDFNMFVVSFFTVTGFLPFYVLYLLSKKDYYGQEIIKTLADTVNKERLLWSRDYKDISRYGKQYLDS